MSRSTTKLTLAIQEQITDEGDSLCWLVVAEMKGTPPSPYDFDFMPWEDKGVTYEDKFLAMMAMDREIESAMARGDTSVDWTSAREPKIV